LWGPQVIRILKELKQKYPDKELDQLYDVFLHMKAKWKTDVNIYLSAIINRPGCMLLECFVF
jgi:uncharacterized protein YciU (UPF0263 family)